MGKTCHLIEFMMIQLKDGIQGVKSCGDFSGHGFLHTGDT